MDMGAGAGRASVEPVARKGGHMEKFMLSLREDSMRIVLLEAERRGVSVEEMRRAVIIPERIRGNIRNDKILWFVGGCVRLHASICLGFVWYLFLVYLAVLCGA